MITEKLEISNTTSLLLRLIMIYPESQHRLTYINQNMILWLHQRYDDTLKHEDRLHVIVLQNIIHNDKITKLWCSKKKKKLLNIIGKLQMFFFMILGHAMVSGQTTQREKCHYGEEIQSYVICYESIRQTH